MFINILLYIHGLTTCINFNTTKNYLRFYYNNSLYEFNCLVFGLDSAPYTFSKLMKPVLQVLRSRGISCVNYLDDFLILGSSSDDCYKTTIAAVRFLASLGFLINKEKSVVKPNIRFKFLGFIFDTHNMTLELPLDKHKRILHWISYFSLRNRGKIFAQFIGLGVSACPSVKYGWLYTKLFDREIFSALTSNFKNYNAIMFLSSDLLPEFRWWQDSIMSATVVLQ